MNVTDKDRERAQALLDLAYQAAYDTQFEPKPGDVTDEQVIDAIAAALAEERNRARKPFIKLAHRYGEEGADSMRQGAGVYSQIAREIRRAAEEPTE